MIDSDQINAFALPVGFFFVNSGLILNADTGAEFAGVMAHEISHVIAHYAMREQTRIAATQREIATLLPPRAQYLETTSEFQNVKARLARIEDKRICGMDRWEASQRCGAQPHRLAVRRPFYSAQQR